jgi:hypothetical protein
MKFLNTPLEENLFKELKIMVIRKDLSLQKAINEAVKDLLKKYEEQDKINV